MKDDKECNFSIEKVSQRGPFYQQPAGRLTNLRSKVTFYEGQIDPLFTENNSVKHSLTSLSRLVSISTEILRGLLPVAHDPAKKLKLELASIDEIARMISLDWRDMEEKISQLEIQTEQLEEEARRWEMGLEKEQKLHLQDVLRLQQYIRKLIEEYELKLRSLREADELLRREWASYKQMCQHQKAAHSSLVESMDRELVLFKQEARCKEDDYRRCITRLQDQHEASLIEFEESKKTLKLICERMANERLQEQAEAYELIVKAKEEEKIVLRRQMEEQASIFQAKISSKEQEILSNKRVQSALRDQLRGVEDQLYQKKEQLTRQQVQNKSLQQELSRASRSGEALAQKLNKYHKNIEDLKRELKDTVQIYEYDIKMLREEGGQALKRKEEQNNALQLELIEKEKEIREMITNFEEAELQMANKLNADRRAYEIKESELAQEISRQIKRVAEEKEKAQKIEQEKAQQLQKMVREHKKMFDQLQKERERERQQMSQKESKRIAKIKAEIQEQLSKMMQANDQQMAKQRSKYEVQIKKKEAEHATQLAKQQQFFQIEKNMLSSHLQKAQRQQEQLEERLAQTVQEAQRQRQQRKREQAENILKLQALRQACALQTQQLQQQMSIQRAQLLRQVELREGKIASLKQQFSQQRQELQKKLMQKDQALKTLKASHLQQLHKLKQASGLATIERGFQQKISELTQRHNSQIYNLKGQFAQQISELERQSQAKIAGVRQELERQLAEQNSNWQNQLSIINQQYHTTLIDIAKVTQKRTVFFDEKFLVVDIERDLGKATRQEKAQFITQRIEEKNREIIAKAQQANRLKSQLQKYERYFEEELKRRRQQLQRQKDMMLADCFKKISNKELQCRNRVDAVEEERIKFSLQMRSEFTTLICEHQRQVSKLRLKCDQLQRILAQRPSRAEDVSKIKQLINIQAKLDQQISICNRKVDTANEIVKYLNLELANYKQTYDIFGPSNQSPFNNRTVSFKQSNVQQHYRDDRWLQRNTESPDVKEIQVFADRESNKSEDQTPLMPKDIKETPSKRKYSLAAQKPRERFKTEKQGKGDTLIEHASTFMRLIKAQQQGVQSKEGQIQDPKRKTYRKRKLKRLTTNVEHYF